MNLVRFTFNNFFDYSIITEQLHIKSQWLFSPDEFTLIFPYRFTSEHAIKYIEKLCEPLNIQFITTIEVTKDTE